MDMRSLEHQIREGLNTYPAKTRRVAEYILGNYSDIAFRSISEIARKLNVSKAQLVRVARMFGFDGYASLKEVLKQELISQVAPTSAIGKDKDKDIKKDRNTHLPKDLCRLEQANIEETYKNLGSGSIIKFCEAAKQAGTIYCMGWGISSLVVEWFHTRFAELGLKSVLIRRGSLSLTEQARGISSQDMLIICELPSYVIEVTEAAAQAKAHGAFIVTLTDSAAAPVCAHANLPLYISDRSPTFGSSLIGPMFAVHILTSVLAYNMGEAGQKALAEQKESLSDSRVYYPAYGLRY